MNYPVNETLKILSTDEVNKIEEFRKSKHTAVLVILFSDIVNSTYATELAGEQTYSKLRHIHDELFIRIMCRDNAGVIIKKIGDSFLCVFAEPSTAVLRAIEFQRTIRKNQDHLTVNNYTLTVRIGIHIGQVVVENSLAMDIFGNHVNRAARIESIANGGQILTSHAIWENAVGWLKNNNEEAIGWISYGKVKLKGVESKTDIYGFYPKETGPATVPKIFRKHRQTRIFLGLAGLLLITALSFFLVISINQKVQRDHGEINSVTPERRSFYVRFDFSEVPGLDTASIKDILLSQIITSLYPDPVVTESDLITTAARQGKLYKKHEWDKLIEEKYFRDTLNLSGALLIKGIGIKNIKNDSVAFTSGLVLWNDKLRSLSVDSLLSKTKDLKNYFRDWMQKQLTAFRLYDQLGIVLECNDSIVLFQIAKEITLIQGSAIKLTRIYAKRAGLNLWVTEHTKKIEYLKDKPQFSEELKAEKTNFESNIAVITDDLINNKNDWRIDVGITGKIVEIYDSVGKVTWTNKGIFPFVKPQKGDIIYLDY